MVIAQPGNQAYFSVMRRGWELLERQEGVMQSMAVIKTDGEDLTIREVSGSRRGTHINGLSVGDEKEIKKADLPRLAARKLIILHSGRQSDGSWTIVGEDLQPREISGQKVTEPYHGCL